MWFNQTRINRIIRALAGPEPEPQEYRSVVQGHPWQPHPSCPGVTWCPNCCISVTKVEGEDRLLSAASVIPAPPSGPGYRTGPCGGNLPRNRKNYFLRSRHSGRIVETTEEAFLKQTRPRRPGLRQSPFVSRPGRRPGGRLTA